MANVEIITAEYITQDAIWNSRLVVTRWNRDGNKLVRISSKVLTNMRDIAAPVTVVTGEHALQHVDHIELAAEKPESWGICGWRLATISEAEARRLEAASLEAAAALDAVEAEATLRKDAAIEILKAIPAAASADLAAVNAAYASRAAASNEGGEGFVPVVGWDSKSGREILARHAVDASAVIAALDILKA